MRRHSTETPVTANSGNMYAADVYKLMEGTADAAFAVTLGGEICFWNGATEQLFGYRASEVLNKSCDEVLEGTGSLGTLVCSQGCTCRIRVVLRTAAFSTRKAAIPGSSAIRCPGKWLAKSSTVWRRRVRRRGPRLKAVVNAIANLENIRVRDLMQLLTSVCGPGEARTRKYA